jgi:hypothetical protein
MDALGAISSKNTVSCDISDSNLAKMDTLDKLNIIKPGVYCISSEQHDLAKMDASMQKYFIIPESYIDLAKMDKIDIHQILQYFASIT